MSEYTYLAADLRTNAILAELPCTGVSFSTMLDGDGDFTASLKIDDARTKKIDAAGSTQERRTALYVDRDGVLVWGGVLWTRRYNDDRRQFALAGNEFGSYFKRRRIRVKKKYMATDQLAIARDLINYAQSVTGGNIGVQVGTETSGVLRDRTYFAYEDKNLGEAIEQLGAVENGFDFAFDVRYDSNGEPAKYLVLSYPRRGRIVGQTALLFEKPGNIIGYNEDEDGTNSPNSVAALGAGDGDNMLRSVASVPALIDSGYPLLEDSRSYKDVSVRSTLDEHARADVAAVASGAKNMTIAVRGDHDPVFGSYIAGDDIELRITDDRYERPDTGGPGLREFRRIAAIAVTPPETKPETIALTLTKAG